VQWIQLGVPSASWLCVHVAAHSNWLSFLCCSRPSGKDIAHLVDFDIAFQLLALCNKPVSGIFIVLCECQTTHSGAGRKSAPLRAGALEGVIQSVGVDLRLLGSHVEAIQACLSSLVPQELMVVMGIGQVVETRFPTANASMAPTSLQLAMTVQDAFLAIGMPHTDKRCAVDKLRR
jgi:hypothetical protein